MKYFTSMCCAAKNASNCLAGHCSNMILVVKILFRNGMPEILNFKISTVVVLIHHFSTKCRFSSIIECTVDDEIQYHLHERGA